MEPMLGNIHMDNGEYSWLTCDGRNREINDGECCESYADTGWHYHGIDWVIAGCESGPAARPMDLDWVRYLRDQCRAANVPFFLKQAKFDGKLVKMPFLDGKQWMEYPNEHD